MLVSLLVMMVCLGGGIARAAITLTDAAGRQVQLLAPAQRIVMNDSLLLLSLALIDPDPIAKIAGWAAPQRIDRGVYAAFRQRFPAIDAVPAVGTVVPANVSVESILGLQPDLFVVSLWHPGWSNVTDRLTAAGIPVLFLDGPENARRDPVEAIAFSIALLGKATGQEEKAGAYASFIRAHQQSVAKRLQGTTKRPKVLIDAFAGADCCSTPGADNRLTQYVALAGGESIGAALVRGYDGRLSPEYVLRVDPDLYIGTGGPHLANQNGLVLGGGLGAEAARTSLKSVLSRNIRRELSSVRQGRAYGVSHQLAISALSILVFECFAKWTHPDLFADLDPAATLAEINQRFLAVPLEGTFWIGLEDEVGGKSR